MTLRITTTLFGFGFTVLGVIHAAASSTTTARESIDVPNGCANSKWEPETRSCYLYVREGVDFYKANETCKTLEANLVSIISDEENQLIRKYFGNLHVWIGLYRATNEVCLGAECLNWMWLDGKEVGYEQWAMALETTGQCVYQDAQMEWRHSDPCSLNKSYVCKQKRILPTTTSGPTTLPSMSKLTTFSDPVATVDSPVANEDSSTYIGVSVSVVILIIAVSIGLGVYCTKTRRGEKRDTQTSSGTSKLWSSSIGTGEYENCNPDASCGQHSAYENSVQFNTLCGQEEEIHTSVDPEHAEENPAYEKVNNYSEAPPRRPQNPPSVIIIWVREKGKLQAKLQDGCPNSNWTSENRSCYLYMQERVDFDKANESCKALGANLVSISSAEENQFIREYVSDTYLPVWIGLYRTNNENCLGAACRNWMWLDGSETGYTQWAIAFPSPGQCVHMIVQGTWGHNFPCSTQYGYVCKQKRTILATTSEHTTKTSTRKTATFSDFETTIDSPFASDESSIYIGVGVSVVILIISVSIGLGVYFMKTLRGQNRNTQTSSGTSKMGSSSTGTEEYENYNQDAHCGQHPAYANGVQLNTLSRQTGTGIDSEHTEESPAYEKVNNYFEVSPQYTFLQVASTAGSNAEGNAL